MPPSWKLSVETSRIPAELVRLVIVLLFLAQLGFCAVRLVIPLLANAQWPEPALIGLALLATIAGLSRELPLQNILLAVLVVGGLTSSISFLGVAAGVSVTAPLGRAAGGWEILPGVSWTIPLSWAAGLLCSRGMARLILIGILHGRGRARCPQRAAGPSRRGVDTAPYPHAGPSRRGVDTAPYPHAGPSRRGADTAPYRQVPNYGYWVLGITVMLAGLLQALVEASAFGLPSPPGQAPHFMNALSIGWLRYPTTAAVALIVVSLVTPILLNKKPSQPAVDLYPAIVWVSMTALLATSLLRSGMVVAGAIALVLAVVTGSLGIRGAIRQARERHFACRWASNP